MAQGTSTNTKSATTLDDVLEAVSNATPKRKKTTPQEARKIIDPKDLPRNRPLMVQSSSMDGVDREMTMALVDCEEPKFYKEPSWGKFPLHHWLDVPSMAALLLVGARGTGKSLIAQIIAARAKRPLLVVNCNPEWTAFDLLATQRLNLKERGGDYLIPGPIRIAAATGAICLFDEFTLLGPGTQAGMNSAIDETQQSVFCVLSGERIHWKEEPRMIFAVNEGYAGTREIQEAFRDRCLTVVAEYLPPAQETAMLVERTKCDRTMARSAVKCATAIREAARTGSADAPTLRFDMSPRALLHFCQLYAIGYESGEAWQMAVIDRAGYTAPSRYIREKLVQISKTHGFTKLIVR